MLSIYCNIIIKVNDPRTSLQITIYIIRIFLFLFDGSSDSQIIFNGCYDDMLNFFLSLFIRLPLCTSMKNSSQYFDIFQYLFARVFKKVHNAYF